MKIAFATSGNIDIVTTIEEIKRINLSNLFIELIDAETNEVMVDQSEAIKCFVVNFFEERGEVGIPHSSRLPLELFNPAFDEAVMKLKFRANGIFDVDETRSDKYKIEDLAVNIFNVNGELMDVESQFLKERILSRL